MQVDLPLIKNVLTPLTKYVVTPSVLTAERSAVDAGIHQKKSYDLGFLVFLIQEQQH